MLDPAALLAFGLIYLAGLFLIAYATERHWLPAGIAAHPATYVLSIGVYATTWSYYGSVGVADTYGVNFIAIYLGTSLAFFLAPVLLAPILRICNAHQLTSLADLFAFRFNSRWVGFTVTAMLIVAVCPYVALQIRAIVESTRELAPTADRDTVAMIFCAMVALFSTIFGTRRHSGRPGHAGLVNAIAFESLFKLMVLLTIAIVGMVMAFGGWTGMQDWLVVHPEKMAEFYPKGTGDTWLTFMTLSFAAGFLLPRQFHMLFAESIRPSNMRFAAWGFPLFLLLLTIAVPPILWSGEALFPEREPQYYVLAIALETGSSVLGVLAFLGGVSAASAMIIVSTLALSSMVMNHVALPVTGLPSKKNLYRGLVWTRRLIIVAGIAVGYLFYRQLHLSPTLVGWGLISFIAIAQFLPPLLGALFWSRGTRIGFFAGLAGGSTIWFLLILAPSMSGGELATHLGIPQGVWSQITTVSFATFASLSLNAVLFVACSLLSKPDRAQQAAAEAFQQFAMPMVEGELAAASPHEFVSHLSETIGFDAAQKEVARALRDLALDWDETRNDQLFRLRERIKNNLSGMLGPVLARMIIEESLATDHEVRTELAQSIRLIEDRLETYRSQFVGVARELDMARQYHREVLRSLPLGVAAITAGGVIVRWNPAIATLTGVDETQAVRANIRDLPQPWQGLIEAFLAQTDTDRTTDKVELGGEERFLTLHKARQRGGEGDVVLLIEDVSDQFRLRKSETRNRELNQNLREIQRLNSELEDAIAALSKSEERYSLAVEGARDGIWDWDLSTGTLYLSPRWKHMLGFDDVTFQSAPEAWLALVHPEDRVKLKTALQKVRDGAIDELRLECRVNHRNGESRWMLYRGVSRKNPQGEPIRLAGSQTDITAQKKLENKLKEMATHDPLTGLLNRAAFDQALSTQWGTSIREGFSLALIMLDVDYFKTYNDHYGHQGGDACLQRIAESLRQSVRRPGDIVTRYGGEEFCVFLPHTDLSGALCVAKRIEHMVEELDLAHEASTVSDRITVSMGVAVIRPNRHTSADKLVRDADIALYEAKAAGRGRIVAAQTED